MFDWIKKLLPRKWTCVHPKEWRRPLRGYHTVCDEKVGGCGQTFGRPAYDEPLPTIKPKRKYTRRKPVAKRKPNTKRKTAVKRKQARKK